MPTVEIALHWLAVVFYVAGTSLYIIGVLWGKEKYHRWGIWLAAFGLVPHGIALGIRWSFTGRVPSYGRFEAYSSMVWVGLAIYFILRRRHWALDLIGLIVLPASLLVLGMVVMSSAEIRQAPETFKVFWLAVHVLFAKLTYGFNLIGAAFAALYLWKSRCETAAGCAGSAQLHLFHRLPAAKVLDEWSYLCISTGFIFLTVMIVSGSIWANSAWGSYWSWDPVESWSLVAWLVYGLYLHLRRTLHWRGPAVTWIGIVAFFLTLFALIGLGFLDAGMHSQYLA